MNQKLLFIIGGIGVVVVLFLSRRGGTSAPMVISGGNTEVQSQKEIAFESIKADAYKSALSADLERYRIDKESGLQTLQTNVAQTIGLASVNKAAEAEVARANADREIAQLNQTLSLASIRANLEAFLSGQSAQVEAARYANLTSLQQAQVQAGAVQSQANAQRNASIFNGIFSIGKSIIDSIFNKDRRSGATVPVWGGGF